ncbi:hypothetical protein BDZ89DRAFT_504823 [Hymenopellis radicata]|nr:hypothetical protein BDZ89DRAFT_504823 [Hymenopellis radicata]
MGRLPQRIWFSGIVPQANPEDSAFDNHINFLAGLVSATIYHEVQRALEHAEDVPQFMKKMSDSRNITLLIQCTFLGAYLQAGRAQDAACATGLLLLTIHVSFLYNNMSPEVFHVGDIGVPYHAY